MKKNPILNFYKFLLTWLGGILPARAVYDMKASFNYVQTGQWMRAKGYDTRRRFSTREQLFEHIGSTIRDRVVLYLEFGVFQGKATRSWSKILRNPDSKLHGFDSFEGLPEDWLLVCEKGHFTTNGGIPQIDDSRVQFFKGWFDETLPNYECPPHEILVINIDSDLYSSAVTVLRSLQDHIVPGTYIHFDEFNHIDDEPRAFDELVRDTGMKFSLVGVTSTLQHAAFRRE